MKDKQNVSFRVLTYLGTYKICLVTNRRVKKTSYLKLQCGYIILYLTKQTIFGYLGLRLISNTYLYFQGF